MKKIIAVFLALLVVFAGTWVVKAKTPASRPDAFADGYSSLTAWWNNATVTPSAINTDWQLDPEIPSDYIPVPGTDEIYMVVDESGNIVKYRQRTRQDDGSWVWSDINPDIPEDYEPVEGLENVYKVTDEDGTIHYVKYIRNDDNTYAFVEVDENGNMIEKEAPVGAVIPDNYEHVKGNIYAVRDENGVIIGYKERFLNDDGTYYWVDVEKPEEETTAPEAGVYAPDPSSQTASASGEQGGGSGWWESGIGGTGDININIGDGNGSGNNNQGGGNASAGNAGSGSGSSNVGAYIETEVYVSTETENGWTVTYQTTVIYTYDKYGNLISTKKDTPVEISRVPAGSSGGAAPSTSEMAADLSSEVARISVGVGFNSSLASEILTQMNAERAAAGLMPLSLSSGNAGQIAKARAAAMAVYDYSDYDSPLYGTVDDMCATFGISPGIPSENTWKTTSDKTAAQVNQRFMALDSSKTAMLSAAYSEVGIAVAEKNGYYYICEVFMN